MLDFQQTISRPVRFSGVGLHSGKPVTCIIHPAPENHGIRFCRVDLPNKPVISALFRNVVDTSLATVLGENGVIVSTIEHLMAAFSGLCIDNALVELSAYEVPIMDGSALPVTKLLMEAGTTAQSAARVYMAVSRPITHEQDGRSVSVQPSDKYEISCTIEFPHPLLRSQTFCLLVDAENFSRDICGARTFGFLHEYEYLKRYGFAKGGNLDNAVVLNETGVVNEDGLRYPDEFVRHKILDCLGDFSLLGIPLLGKITTVKSGHAFNHALITKILKEKDCWVTVTSETYRPPASD
ncbi:MAG: UDP-3-O-acyl-N-acetylglucosamine deacetylase [Thermodesulfobacteriota bacterium]